MEAGSLRLPDGSWIFTKKLVEHLEKHSLFHLKMLVKCGDYCDECYDRTFHVAVKEIPDCIHVRLLYIYQYVNINVNRRRQCRLYLVALL